MNFKEFLDKYILFHRNFLALVEEYNEKGEFVQSYTNFGIEEPATEEDVPQLYCLWSERDTMFDSVFIDLTEPVVKLENNRVFVRDTNDVLMQLEFVRGDVIAFDNAEFNQ